MTRFGLFILSPVLLILACQQDASPKRDPRLNDQVNGASFAVSEEKSLPALGLAGCPSNNNNQDCPRIEIVQIASPSNYGGLGCPIDVATGAWQSFAPTCVQDECTKATVNIAHMSLFVKVTDCAGHISGAAFGLVNNVDQSILCKLQNYKGPWGGQVFTNWVAKNKLTVMLTPRTFINNSNKPSRASAKVIMAAIEKKIKSDPLPCAVPPVPGVNCQAHAQHAANLIETWAKNNMYSGMDTACAPEDNTGSQMCSCNLWYELSFKSYQGCPQPGYPGRDACIKEVDAMCAAEHLYLNANFVTSSCKDVADDPGCFMDPSGSRQCCTTQICRDAIIGGAQGTISKGPCDYRLSSASGCEVMAPDSGEVCGAVVGPWVAPPSAANVNITTCQSCCDEKVGFSTFGSFLNDNCVRICEDAVAKKRANWIPNCTCNVWYNPDRKCLDQSALVIEGVKFYTDKCTDQADCPFIPGLDPNMCIAASQVSGPVRNQNGCSYRATSASGCSKL